MNAIWETACRNAAYLAAICDLKLRFRATTGGQGCDLGSCVAKTLRFCVCVWKATKPASALRMPLKMPWKCPWKVPLEMPLKVLWIPFLQMALQTEINNYQKGQGVFLLIKWAFCKQFSPLRYRTFTSLKKGKFVLQKSLFKTPFKPDRVSFCTRNFYGTILRRDYHQSFSRNPTLARIKKGWLSGDFLLIFLCLRPKGPQKNLQRNPGYQWYARKSGKSPAQK